MNITNSNGQSDYSGNKTYREMSTPELMYDTIIAPFLTPFSELLSHTIVKLVTGVAVGILMYVSAWLEMVSGPIEYWMALFTLAGLDFVAGSTRALMDSRLTFDAKKWGRSAYKFVTYSIALVSTSIAVNVYPTALGAVQYIVVGILVVAELFSIFRNIKMAAVLAAALKAAKDTSINSINDFRSLVEEQDEKFYKDEADSFHKEVKS